MFRLAPIYNEDTQIRPASGISPVLGLFFGIPAIVGCSLANFVSDAFYESDPLTLAIYLLIQLIYNAVPYVLWYTVTRKRENPFPELDSAKSILLYLVVVFVAAAAVTLMIMPFEQDTLQEYNINLVRILNNLVFLIYLGMPLLIVLSSSPLAPSKPLWIKQSYTKLPRMYLTQKTVIGSCMIGVVLLAVYIYATYRSDFLPNLTQFEFAHLINAIYVDVAILTLVIFVPMTIIAYLLEKKITNPLESLTAASESFIEKLLSTDRLTITISQRFEGDKLKQPVYEVNQLQRAVYDMQEGLIDYADRLTAITAEKERVVVELDIARKIQQDALPKNLSSLGGKYALEVQGFSQPAREVGGDFYDVFVLDENRLCFVVGDVSGKGVAAALFMMRVLAVIREQTMIQPSLTQALTTINNQLCENNDVLLFVTAFVGILDVTSGEMIYVNAGHNMPWIQQRGSGSWLQSKPGLVLGLFSGQEYQEHKLAFLPGGGMVLYTDGLTEATNVESDLFGEVKLAECFRRFSDQRIERTFSETLDAVSTFQGEEQFEDITLLAFKWIPEVSSVTVEPEKEALSQIESFTQQFCQSHALSPKMHAELSLIIEELFVNVVTHGFVEGQERGPVVIEYGLDRERELLHILITDNGKEFDPTQNFKSKITNEVDLAVGGLGILLVRQKTERMSYQRQGEHNMLSLVKRIV